MDRLNRETGEPLELSHDQLLSLIDQMEDEWRADDLEPVNGDEEE